MVFLLQYHYVIMLTSALCDVSASVYVIVTLKFQTSSHYLLLTFKLWCYVYRFLWCYFILSTLHTLDEELLAVTLENLAVSVVSGILLHIYYRLSTLHTPLIESNISIEGGMSLLSYVIEGVGEERREEEGREERVGRRRGWRGGEGGGKEEEEEEKKRGAGIIREERGVRRSRGG